MSGQKSNRAQLVLIRYLLRVWQNLGTWRWERIMDRELLSYHVNPSDMVTGSSGPLCIPSSWMAVLLLHVNDCANELKFLTKAAELHAVWSVADETSFKTLHVFLFCSFNEWFSHSVLKCVPFPESPKQVFRLLSAQYIFFSRVSAFILFVSQRGKKNVQGRGICISTWKTYLCAVRWREISKVWTLENRQRLETWTTLSSTTSSLGSRKTGRGE